MTEEERITVENIYLYLIIFLASGVFFSVVGIISNVRLLLFVGEVLIAGGAFAIIVNKMLSRYTLYTFGRRLGIEPTETLLAGISRVILKQKFLILQRDTQWQLIGSQESSLWSVKNRNIIDLICEENIDGLVFERAATTNEEISVPTIMVIDMINDTISKPPLNDIPEFSWPGHIKYRIEYNFRAKRPYRIEQYVEYPPSNDPSKDDFIDTGVFSDTLSTKLSITFQGIDPKGFFFEAYIVDDTHTKYKNLKVTPLSDNQVIVVEHGYEDLKKIGFTRKGDHIFFWHKPL